jgi:hypothetical protein
VIACAVITTRISSYTRKSHGRLGRPSSQRRVFLYEDLKLRWKEEKGGRKTTDGLYTRNSCLGFYKPGLRDYRSHALRNYRVYVTR